MSTFEFGYYIVMSVERNGNVTNLGVALYGGPNGKQLSVKTDTMDRAAKRGDVTAAFACAKPNYAAEYLATFPTLDSVNKALLCDSQIYSSFKISELHGTVLKPGTLEWLYGYFVEGKEA